MKQSIKRIGALPLLLLAAGCASIPASAGSEARARILMLGVFHFSNPGLDAYKPKHTFDTTSPQRQREIAEITELMAAFRPTKIAVEFRPQRQDEIDELYRKYLRGEYELGTNEVYQLGFRLAAKLGHDRVHLIDAPARHLFTQKEYEEKLGSLEARAATSAAADGWDDRYQQLYAHDDERKTTRPLREHLLYINSPERIRRGHGHYLVGSFKRGEGFTEANDGYFGPDSATGWYNRNLRIFRNLQALTESPEERILLIIGSGHLPILRFLVQSSPEHELVEVDEYL
ncbi:MAG TPA: DUF5694 domain-containing protein [Thermoanaerobaculia bacterium]|nr:DUF5694 domain-containing protein [Thermoanaerobaculia bacterium]